MPKNREEKDHSTVMNNSDVKGRISKSWDRLHQQIYSFFFFSFFSVWLVFFWYFLGHSPNTRDEQRLLAKCRQSQHRGQSRQAHGIQRSAAIP